MALKTYIEEVWQTLQSFSGLENRSLVLGYSGGVDSEVLAFLLSQLKQSQPQLSVKLVYINHGLSCFADDWQKHCEQRAIQYQLPFVAKSVKVKQGSRLSLEAEARKARYQALLEEMHSGDILLTAHHQDDQLETLLLALKRGQGPKGLSGMAPVQVIEKEVIQYRPLLNLSKSAIQELAQQHKISHIEDDSNQDDSFDRNFLRLNIIPALKKRWTSIATTGSRTAELCGEQQALLDEVVGEKLTSYLADSPYAEKVLTLAGFNELSRPWQRQIFRAFIAFIKLPIPSRVQLDEILDQVLNAKSDASVELNVSGLTIRRYQGQVFAFASAQLDNKLPQSIVLGTQAELAEKDYQVALADGRVLQLSEILNQVQLSESAPLSIRFNLAGSTQCHPHFRHKSRALKKLWQELKVPPWERAKVPMLFINGKFVSAVNLWIEKDYFKVGVVE
ncbi:tRNA lysidine(34) synthetase TilS [Parashewanella curva]|uniref:tRNA(Ile)-lysidine synthase n=1 Tax=Parashewanella curva TaxID=2338552 RepID=A0A3L8PZ16_9GAMM|nr:tRNA lysidine(34) synthetase TilS [Parashewanella curva]RLV59833.1 tRNA lysidine(34) synthetase TilS [Parashewanella curva]